MIRIELTKKALKQLNNFPPNVEEQIYYALEQLESGAENLDIKKLESEINVYRLRKGDYRIIYELDKSNNTLIVLEITIRGKSYRHN